jgi:hypothetical protein
MTGDERRTRVRASLAAAGAGWLAAMAATLPMVLDKVWTDNIVWASGAGGWRSLLWSLALGAGVWAAWTFAIAFGAWSLGALPAIALVREEWLLRHKWLAVVLAAAMAELVVLAKFQFWLWFLPQFYIEPWLLILYTLLLVVFAAATGCVYLLLVGRHRLRSIGAAAWRARGAEERKLV